jgi:hypothetical protein
MSNALDPGQLLDVQVDQLPGPIPLVAHDRRPSLGVGQPTQSCVNLFL